MTIRETNATIMLRFANLSRVYSRVLHMPAKQSIRVVCVIDNRYYPWRLYVCRG